MNTERLKELFALLESRESLEAYAMSEEGKQRITEAVPEAQIMFGYDQHSPWHEYELWTHTAKVIDGIDKRLSHNLYRKLRIAAFFHDIGKPDTAMPKKTDDGTKHSSYPNHADRSALIAEPYLRACLNEEDVSEILLYITGHDLFLNLTEKEAPDHRNYINAENINRLMQRHKELFPELPCQVHEFYRMMYLCESDAAAHKKIVYEKDGSVKDTRKQMVARTRLIRRIIKEELL